MHWLPQHRFSLCLLLATAISAVPMFLLSETLTANNNIETWLPARGEDQEKYEAFCRDFGHEEVIIIAFPERNADDKLLTSLSKRLQNSESLSQCLSPEQCRSQLLEYGCAPEDIDQRLERMGLLSTSHDPAIVCVLNDHGTQDRLRTVEAIRSELTYCNLKPEHYLLAGSPVIVAELDQLGGHKITKVFFLIAFALCFVMLLVILKNSKLTTSITLLTGWGILATQCSIIFIAGQTNFILGALAVMTMIFSLAISIHVWHYYCDAHTKGECVQAAVRAALIPCFWATLTTTIGLVSLQFSGIQPVQSFGMCAAVGCVLALFCGIVLLPAVLKLDPQPVQQLGSEHVWAEHFASWVISSRTSIAVGGTLFVLISGAGVASLTARLEPLDFLPEDNRSVSDLLTVASEYTGTDSIEAIVDFELQDLPFLEKLNRIQQIEQELMAQEGIRDVLSAATFLPAEFGADAWAVTDLLRKLNSSTHSNPFVSADMRCWRLSVRVNPQAEISQIKQQLENHFHPSVAISFTGMAPMIDQGQWTIFNGFWDSFTSALVIISLMMALALRSIRFALLTMIPNIAPLMIVFGTMGWLGISIDIGMMMTGSIALGIAVDGTFHLVTRFRKELDQGLNRQQAAHAALRQTAVPIAQSAVIASIGMLALTISPFGPTAQFGLLMAILLMVAVVGDLVLLPAYLCLGGTSSDHRTLEQVFSFPAKTHAADAAAV